MLPFSCWTLTTEWKWLKLLHFSHLVNFPGWLDTVVPEWLKEAEEDMTPIEQIHILSRLLYTGETDMPFEMFFLFFLLVCFWREHI